MSERSIKSIQAVQRWRVRLIREALAEYEHVSSVAQVVEYFAFLREETVECFYVAFLDTQNRIIGTQEVCRGIINQVTISPREVFQAAILANCTSIILVHGHPSGCPEPSDQDRALTRQLVQAGELLAIHVTDHVIIGDPESYSFLAAGELKPRGRHLRRETNAD